LKAPPLLRIRYGSFSVFSFFFVVIQEIETTVA